MTQLLIDRATLEQLVRMLEQCLDDAIQVQCDLEQGYSKSLALAQMVQVELSKEALTAGREALANAESTGWQPIETAPKDAIILLGLPAINGIGQDDRRVYEGRWHTTQATWTSVNGFLLLGAATRWMPLPAAPKDTL